jgi:aspartyl protease family protein
MSEQANPPTFNTFTVALIWIALLAGASFFFDDALEKIKNPNQTVTTHVNNEGEHEIVLKQNRQGHYVANGQINGQPVQFLLDTGATNVAIPEHIANQLKLKKGMSHQTVTANGTSTSYMTRLDSISLGSLEMQNVPASISQGMQFDEILLGMSFLKHLKITQQGKLLTLSIPEQNR